MTPIEHIRRKILSMSQAELAAIADVSQATVSRWENGELTPNLTELDRIRGEITRRGLEWDDRFFFEPPTPPPEQEGAGS